MERDVILKVGLCVCAGIALGSVFIFLLGLVNEHSAGEPDEPGEGERGVLSLYGNEGEVFLDFLETELDEATDLRYFDGDEESRDTLYWGDDLTLDGGLSDIADDNALTFKVVPGELQFGGWGLDDILMSYDVGEKHWTLSDRFLEDVADALVPVLKERGFAHNAEEE